MLVLTVCLAHNQSWTDLISVASVNTNVPLYVRYWDLRSSTHSVSMISLGFYQGVVSEKNFPVVYNNSGKFSLQFEV